MFRRHHYIGSAIALPGDHRHFRHGGFRIGKEQLGTMLDQAAIFLRCSGKDARHIDESHDRYVETVAESYEPRGLPRTIAVEYACEHHRLIGDKAYPVALYSRETHDDVLCMRLLDLEEVSLVHRLVNELFHVIGLIGIGRDERVE